MRHSLALLCLTSSLLFNPASLYTVAASPITENAAKAEQLLKSGQPGAAYKAIQAAVDAVWKQMPMMVNNVGFATEIYGFRSYKAKENAIFKPDEPHIIYAEPIGFTHHKDKDGRLSAGYLADFVLTDPKGKVLLQQEGLLNLNLPLGAENKEVHLNITVNLDGLPEGKYVSHYKLRDKYSEKNATFSLPFEVHK
ncbi:MAG: hypothetical protein N4A65_10605 [Cohaesibacter sp.]|jgi:hypothetical protein|nr:hypothetical protein [Cohaesibacter sp.]